MASQFPSLIALFLVRVESHGASNSRRIPKNTARAFMIESIHHILGTAPQAGGTPDDHDRVFAEIGVPLSVLLPGSGLLRHGRQGDRRAGDETDQCKQCVSFPGQFSLCLFLGYSAILLLRVASSSFLMSSGDNCGRSTLIVSLLSLAVKGNGGL